MAFRDDATIFKTENNRGLESDLLYVYENVLWLCGPVPSFFADLLACPGSTGHFCAVILSFFRRHSKKD